MMCNMMAKKQPASSESGESLLESPGGSPTHQSATRTTSLRCCEPHSWLHINLSTQQSEEGPLLVDEAEVYRRLDM